MRSSKKRSKLRSSVPWQPSRSALVNKFIAKHKKLEPILTICLTVTDAAFVQIDVFEESDIN